MKVVRNRAMLLGFWLMFGATGCISLPEAKTGALQGPPPSPTQVSSCQTTRTWHNIWVIAGTVFGSASGATGTISAVTSDRTVEEGVAIGSASAGVLGALSATAAGIEADTYSTDNCATVLSAAASAGTIH